MRKIIGVMIVSICLLVSSSSYSQNFVPPNVNLKLHVFDADTGGDVRRSTKNFGLIAGVEYHTQSGDAVLDPTWFAGHRVFFKNIFGQDLTVKPVEINSAVNSSDLILMQGEYKFYLGTYQLSSSDILKIRKGLIVTVDLNLSPQGGSGYLASEVIQYRSDK